MLDDVKRRFEDHLKKKLASKPEILKFILEHERKDLCLRNLVDQIRKCEGLVINFSAAKYDKVIKDVAILFGKAVLLHKEESLMSSSQKQRQLAKRDELKDMEQFIADVEKEAYRDADEREKTDLDQILKAREKERVRDEIEAERKSKL